MDSIGSMVSVTVLVGLFIFFRFDLSIRALDERILNSSSMVCYSMFYNVPGILCECVQMPVVELKFCSRSTQIIQQN